VIALRQQTGQLVWSHLIGDERPPRMDLEKFDYVGAPPAGQYISAAPAYARGRVIVGLVNGDYGIRGRVVALDAKTGRQAWRFDTVPGPGDFGHDTWPADNDAWQTGGAGVWMTPAVDPDLGLVLFATGNPMPALGGELRPGDNLFANSAVALDLQTGKHRWHFQLVRHDLWEADLGTPLILYDAKIGGRERKAVAVMRTDGYLFLLDRRTGKALFPVDERPVTQSARLKTAATQPFPSDADPLAPQCVASDLVPPGFQLACLYDPVDVDRPNVMLPKFVARSAPMAHDPDNCHFYVTGTVGSIWLKRCDDP
jgi:alcohol dehydrogenase (cytochrome c)